MNKKILLADDSITIQKVIELTFSDEDFDVITVGNGRLAMEKALDVRPDIVLCDIIMPEKNGYEVCEFIKKNPLLSDVPVLLLTGAFEPFDQERATRVGCDGFLAKPFEPQTLIAKVKDLLKQAASRPAAAPPPPPPPPAPAWTPPPPPPFAATPAPSSSGAPPARPKEPFSPGTPQDFGWTTPMPMSTAPAAPPPEAAAPPEPVTAEAAETFFGDEPFSEEMGSPFVETIVDLGPGAARQAFPPSGAVIYPETERPGSPEDLLRVTPEEAESLAPEPAQDNERTMGFEGETTAWAAEPPREALVARPEGVGGAPPATHEPAMFEEVFEEEPPPMVRSGGLSKEPPTEPIIAVAPEAFAASPETAPAAPPPPAAAAPHEPARPFPQDAREEAAPPAVAQPSPVPASEVSTPAPSPAGASGHAELPPDVVAQVTAQVTQKLVGQISEKVIREVVWEVVPELAEALIKKEIERLKDELQRT